VILQVSETARHQGTSESSASLDAELVHTDRASVFVGSNAAAAAADACVWALHRSAIVHVFAC